MNQLKINETDTTMNHTLMNHQLKNSITYKKLLISSVK